MKNTLIIKAILFLFLFTVNLRAETSIWKIDKAHSNFYFDIRHIYSTIRGRFDDFTGDIKFDPDNIAASSFNISIKTGSVNTNERKRDTHLVSADFFSSSEFPEMSFKSNSIKKTSENKYEVTGTLKIRNVSKNITIPFSYNGTKANPFNEKEKVTGLDFIFSIDRHDYKVGDEKFYKMGIVDKDVHITISLELLKAE